MPQNLLDQAIKRQVALERLKQGQVQDFNTVFRDVGRAVKLKVAGLDDDLAGANRNAINGWLKSLEGQVGEVYADQVKLFIPELERTAGIYAALEADDISRALLGGTKINSATPRQAFNLAKRNPLPFSGETMEDFIDGFAQGETSRVVNTFRKGFYQGRTNQQVVRELIGTKANNFTDGVLQTSRRNASTVVRTSMQHAANAGRNATWQANSDVVDKYEWVSTLDSRTSTTCKSLDGQKYELGKGPTPPIHPNCRSTTVAVLSDEFSFLSEGRTRSAADGPTKASDSYYDWLKRQDAAFQDQALGPARGKLLRDGGLTNERFRALQLDKNFEPMTLDEMKVLEPEAFERAFGSGTPAASTPVTPQVAQSVTRKREQVANLLSDADAKKLENYRAEMDKAADAYYKFPKNSKVPSKIAAKNKQAEIYLDRQDKINKLYGDKKLEAHLALSLPKSERANPSTILGTVSLKRTTREMKANLGDAPDFVSRVVRKPLVPVGLGVKPVPRAKKRRGAFYRDEEKSIYLRGDEGQEVVIHEIIHNIEYEHPDIAAKTDAFLKKRAGNESPVSLLRKKGGNYRVDEMAFEDSWETFGGDIYTGKLYNGRPATEVLTMGVQRLFEDPIIFARQDPEFFDFILTTIQ